MELGHEIACHGWRWIHYQHMDEATEREHMRLALTPHRADRPAPAGWYTGRDSPNTRRLVVDDGGLLYDFRTTTATTCRSGPKSPAATA